MRKTYPLLFLAWIIFSDSNTAIAAADTSSIIHKTNGIVDEWPADKFSTDNPTGIQYAIDNDAQNLYLALKIDSHTEQVKLMAAGMSMFIDTKGKRKESRKIEFPVAKETPTISPNEITGMQRSDLQKYRAMCWRNMLTLNLSGYGEDINDQPLLKENSIQIAFSWDSTNTMHIEYVAPLKMLETDIASLRQKVVSIGWKVNKIDNSSTSNGVVTQRLVSVPAGTSRPTTQVTQGTNDRTSLTTDQYIWTKHTFVF